MPVKAVNTERLTTYVKPVHKDLVTKLATERNVTEAAVIREIVEDFFVARFDVSNRLELEKVCQSVHSL